MKVFFADNYTSEYVLHYILEKNYIMLVEMSPHPPLNLPSEDYLIVTEK